MVLRRREDAATVAEDAATVAEDAATIAFGTYVLNVSMEPFACALFDSTQDESIWELQAVRVRFGDGKWQCASRAELIEAGGESLYAARGGRWLSHEPWGRPH